MQVEIVIRSYTQHRIKVLSNLRATEFLDRDLTGIGEEAFLSNHHYDDYSRKSKTLMDKQFSPSKILRSIM